MSAFIIEDEAIHYLVAAHRIWCHPRGLPSIDNSNAVGQMLVDANHASVNWRYGERTDPPAYRYDRAYDHEPLVAAQVIKTAHCLDYQCCEFDGWPECDAKKIIDRIILAAARHVTGYDNARWGAPAWIVKE